MPRPRILRQTHRDNNEMPPLITTPERPSRAGEHGDKIRAYMESIATELPVAACSDEIVKTVTGMPATVFTGETGTGKSTCLPIMLLDTFDRVIMTEPRVAIARTLSERIGSMLVDAVGEEGLGLVGYKTSTEGNDTLDNRIVLLTDGLALMRLINDGNIGRGDVVVIDEFHERNMNMDVDLALCLEKGVQVVIASATMNTTRVADYCATRLGVAEVPIIEVPGTMYDVEERSGGMVVDEIVNAVKPGETVLVFLPGIGDAEDIKTELKKLLPRTCTVLLLNADQTPEEQMACFPQYPDGAVVLSTKVGESSHTMPYVRTVIDSQWERSGGYEAGVRKVPLRPCSRATSKQRRGRVGRIDRQGGAPDVYITAQLPNYPPIPRDDDGELLIPEYDSPESLVIDVASFELRLALAHRALKDIGLLDQPPEHEIVAAKERLRQLGATALDLAGTSLTELGRDMAHMPIDISYARMIAASREFSERIQLQMIAAAAVRQVRGVGSASIDNQGWLELSFDNRSELLTLLDVYINSLAMDEATRQSLGIIEQRVRKATTSFERLARGMDLDPRLLEAPTEEERQALIKCIIAGSNELFIRQSKDGQYRGIRDDVRRLSRIGGLDGSYRLVLGSPLDIDYARARHDDAEVEDSDDVELGSVSIINDGTGVSIEQLVEYAPERCSFESQGTQISLEGIVTIQKLVFFDGVSTDHVIYEQAAPSMEAYCHIIDAISRGHDAYYPISGHTRSVYKALQELEELQHRTSQDLNIRDAVIRAIGPHIPSSAVSIEEAVSYIAPDHIRAAISPETRREILEASPSELEVFYGDGLSFMATVTYHRSRPCIVVSADEVHEMPEGLTTADGQEVVVRVVSESTRGVRRKAVAQHA